MAVLHSADEVTKVGQDTPVLHSADEVTKVGQDMPVLRSADAGATEVGYGGVAVCRRSY